MNEGNDRKNSKPPKLTSLILKGVALVMGVAVAVLSAVKKVHITSAVAMLGAGLVCISLSAFSGKQKQ